MKTPLGAQAVCGIHHSGRQLTDISPVLRTLDHRLDPDWAGAQAESTHLCQHICVGASVVEILVRLGCALLLSLCLAVLFAWGWDRSDTLPGSDNARLLSATTRLAPLR